MTQNAQNIIRLIKATMIALNSFPTDDLLWAMTDDALEALTTDPALKDERAQGMAQDWIADILRITFPMAVKEWYDKKNADVDDLERYIELYKQKERKADDEDAPEPITLDTIMKAVETKAVPVKKNPPTTKKPKKEEEKKPEKKQKEKPAKVKAASVGKKKAEITEKETKKPEKKQEEKPKPETPTFKVNNKVTHKKFGEGKVTAVNGNNITVDFGKDVGQKKVKAEFLAKKVGKK